MSREQIKIVLWGIFTSLFGAEEAEKITESSQAKDVNGWDSLAHMELLEEIEKRFRIRLSYREIASFERVKDIVDCLEKKVGR